MVGIEWIESALGTRAKVRILRHLAIIPDRWNSEADLSRTIGMSPNTVNLAVRDLADNGVVDLRDGGRSHQVRLRLGTPQADAIKGLVDSEALLVERLRSIARRHVRPRESCILFGSAARGSAAPPRDIDLLIIAPTKERAAQIDVMILKEARRVHPGPWRGLHLTPRDLKERRDSSLVAAVRHEGILLAGRALEDFL